MYIYAMAFLHIVLIFLLVVNISHQTIFLSPTGRPNNQNIRIQNSPDHFGYFCKNVCWLPLFFIKAGPLSHCVHQCALKDGRRVVWDSCFGVCIREQKLQNKTLCLTFFFWIPLKRQRNDQNHIPQPSLAGLWHEVLFILAIGIRWRVF